MSNNDDRHGFHAGRLIQWGLRPKSIPFNEPEYRELIDWYTDRPEFRALVQEMADGLGLVILAVNDRGLFLGTQDNSVFALRPSDFRSGRSTADDRLLDGLVQMAIAATIYPRQQDLDEDALEAKPPITCQEVDELLRKLSAEYMCKVQPQTTKELLRGLVIEFPELRHSINEIVKVASGGQITLGDSRSGVNVE